MNDISKDKDYQEFFAGIKELTKGLMQIRERAAIEYAPIVEEFCARKHATANEVGRMLDYLFEFAENCLDALTCVPCDIILMAPFVSFDSVYIGWLVLVPTNRYEQYHLSDISFTQIAKSKHPIY